MTVALLSALISNEKLIFMVVFLFLLSQVLLQIHFIVGIPEVNPKNNEKCCKNKMHRKCEQNMGVTSMSTLPV